MRIAQSARIGAIAALAACSSSPDGGGSGGTASPGTGGGGGAAPTQNGASLLAWARFQGEFNSDDQEPEGDGPSPPPPRRLVGCAVDAPEIGERVVYLERTDPASVGAPDRQFLVSVHADWSGGPESLTAIAWFLRPADPLDWQGGCEPGVTLPLLGPVVDDPACRIVLATGGESTQVSVVREELPATCLDPRSTATTINPGVTVTGNWVEWSDRLTFSDGSFTDDPADSAYFMSRRSELVPVPHE